MEGELLPATTYDQFEVRRHMEDGGYALVGTFARLGDANIAADCRRRLRPGVLVTVERVKVERL